MDASDELQTLWTVVFGEPPLIKAEAGLIAEVLVGALPLVPPYRVAPRPSEQAVRPAFT